MRSAAADIAHAYGRLAQRIPGNGWLIPCPVPSHGKGRGDRNPSLVIKDGDKGLLVRCFADCDVRDVLAELRARGLLDDALRAEPPRYPRRSKAAPIDRDKYAKQQARKAAGLWAHRRPIMGSIAETYLRSRGITGPLPFATLGYLPARRPDHHPAMIACFGLHDEPEPGVLGLPRGMVNSVHLTLLKPDGSDKADVESQKLIIGSPRGRPIELAPANDLLGLAITEGIEDALSVRQATGLGAWAAGAAGFMPALAKMVPDWIECVTICAHADAAGQDGARKLAVALRTRGIHEVRIEGLAP